MALDFFIILIKRKNQDFYINPASVMISGFLNIKTESFFGTLVYNKRFTGYFS